MWTNYNRGATYERDVKKHLESQGWIVIRAGGSRGAVDLMAAKGGTCILLQAKKGGIISFEEKKRLIEASKIAGFPSYLVFPKGLNKFKMIKVSECK